MPKLSTMQDVSRRATKFLPIAFIAFSVECSADAILGRVVAVADGDTIKVLDSERRQHTVRLSGIDAPEKAQAFGQRSKESLSRLVYGKDVEIEWSKRDKYGRIVGKVLIDTTDANLEQIRAGMAWWYWAYSKEQTADDRSRYESAEDDARADQRGLWADTTPIPPWEWRRFQRAGR